MQQSSDPIQANIEERLRFKELLSDISSRFVNITPDQLYRTSYNCESMNLVTIIWSCVASVCLTLATDLAVLIRDMNKHVIEATDDPDSIMKKPSLKELIVNRCLEIENEIMKRDSRVLCKVLSCET